MTPLSYWIYFHVALVALLGVEYLMHRAVPDIRRKAWVATGMWVGAALALAVLLSRRYQVVGATQYLAGYALEQAMSLDNLFVFLLLFRMFRIPPGKQPKVLYWGVAGAIVLRGLFIASGVGLLNRFHWVEYLFGAALLVAALRLLKPADPEVEVQHAPGWIKWLTQWQPISENQDHFFCGGEWAAHGDDHVPCAGGGGADRCGVRAGFDPGGTEYYAAAVFGVYVEYYGGDGVAVVICAAGGGAVEAAVPALWVGGGAWICRNKDAAGGLGDGWAGGVAGGDCGVDGSDGGGVAGGGEKGSF